MIGQGYILEDISDQELTDGVWYRVSREEKWTTTMPDTFSALYVRTVGEQTISARRCSPSSPDSRRSRRPRRSISARPTMFPPNSLPCWPGNEKLGGIRLFENTTSIADGAFKGCTALTRAVVPSGVAAVGAEYVRRVFRSGGGHAAFCPSHRSPTRHSEVVRRCRRSRWVM